MDLGIAGKSALVAASSQGIGLACAKALAREGVNLLLCAREPRRLDDAVVRVDEFGPGLVRGVVADLSSPQGPAQACQAARTHLGRVDILVTNVGGPPALQFEEVDDHHWQAAFDSLLMSVQRLVRLCLPDMQARGWGRVVAITSCACREPIDGLLLSNSVRLSVHGLLKTLASRYAAKGITFNAVLPGYTRTPRIDQIAQARARQSGLTPDEVARQAAAAIPMGRAASPEEVGAAVAFLASARASYITGIGLPVDGGRGNYVL